jgi:3-hydroxyisobutyrate dehydrogenase-like beta-hydroxyacid dehydrogenase
MTSAERVAVVGTGLIGTSIAMAAIRAGEAVRGFDIGPQVLGEAAERSGLAPAATREACIAGATLVFVCPRSSRRSFADRPRPSSATWGASSPTS